MRKGGVNGKASWRISEEGKKENEQEGNRERLGGNKRKVKRKTEEKNGNRELVSESKSEGT